MNDFSRRIATLSQKRLVLLATELQAKIDRQQRQSREPIAIIGAGCRFPGGVEDPEAFWQLLKMGRDAITEISAQRWDVDAYYDDDIQAPGKITTRWAGLIDRPEQFDAAFFGIAPREATTMDPQQRILLEVAWEALERAGIAPPRLSGTKTGVFIGISGSDYYHLQLTKGTADIDAYFASGVAHSVASGRLSYILGLQGPCLSVDTACSSSLVAVHLAVQSLRNGESDTALAGGVNLILSPEITIALSKAEMMAPDGRCKAFDVRANGFVRGEGCGLIVLKRLSDAVRDNDTILALIRGSAINQDGKSNGLTAPNGPSQEAVLRSALENGGIVSEDIHYVETHGTGTALGDPIELRALSAVLCRERKDDNILQIGSVKTNIGHLESAAGIAGLMKTILALQNEEIPPHLHFNAPNPHFDWEDMPLAVTTAHKPWPVSDRPRLAGVSSFGFSGTNAHVIVEEAPPKPSIQPAETNSVHLLTLSAKSEAALRELGTRYADNLQSNPAPSIADICYTASSGRAHFNHRLAVLGRTRDQLQKALTCYTSGDGRGGIEIGQCRPANPPRVVFLFTGQGAQYLDMGRSLYETVPLFRDTLDRCAAILSPYLEESLLAVLYPSDAQKPRCQRLINRTDYTQPALFALNFAMAELWRSWGIEPVAVMGHSLGEFVAACVAGVFSLEDGLRLVAERARLMQSLPPGGAMAAVLANHEDVERVIDGYSESLSISAINGPDQTVISGAERQLEEVLRQFEERGVGFKRLQVSHAFHSPLMEPILDPFEQIASEVQYHAPEIEVVSNITGQCLGPEHMITPTYWRQHARQPVQFEASIRQLFEEGYRIYLEVGPSPILSGMAGRFISNPEAVWLPSLYRSRDDWEQILKTLSVLYVKGLAIDWDAVSSYGSQNRVLLPTYPFQRKRYWFASRQELAKMARPHDALRWRDWFYGLRWEKARLKTTETDRADQQMATIREQGRGFWIIFTDRGGVGAKLGERLHFNGFACITVSMGTAFASGDANTFAIDPYNQEDYRRLVASALDPVAGVCRGVINLWALDENVSDSSDGAELERIQKTICGSALYLTQALVGCETPAPPVLYLFTRGAQPVAASDETLSVAQAPLWGLGKVIMLEHPELRCTCVDLNALPDQNEVLRIVDDILAEPPEYNQMALRHDQWWVPQMSILDFDELIRHKRAFVFRSEGAYLITGGLAGLGLRLAQGLVERGARHLVLMARSAVSQPAAQVIDQMQEEGAQILVVQGDVSVFEDVERAVEMTEGSLCGVFHCAGALDDGILLQQNWDRFRTVIAGKVQGAWNLHKATRNHRLDCFVLFSSAASLLGSAGQGNYAAANAFLDGLVHYRRHQGLPGLSVNWGAWNKVGMASRHGVVERLHTQGQGSIEPAEGIEILGHLLGNDIAQIGVLPVHWSVLLDTYGGRPEMELLKQLQSQSPDASNEAETTAKDAKLFKEWAQVPAGRRHPFLVTKVFQEASQILGLQPNDQIDVDQPLTDLGLDSLMAVQLRNALSSLTGEALPATLLFNYPSVDQIVNFLDRELQRAKRNLDVSTPQDRDSKPPGQSRSFTAEELEELSEEDMVNLLADKLSEN